MTIEAVIGANYGDEGKGLFTEYLCRSRPSPLVVLSNGGSQRGHTVNNVEKGIRHVFHHFGSGTLLGVPSVYSKTFLLNPIKYIEEKRELEKVGIKPIAFRAPSCLLQLPSDMFTNQMLEKARGQSKHGSCGWGIWETVVRNKYTAQLTFEDFAQMGYARKRAKLQDILEWQLENRLALVDKTLHAAVDNTLFDELLGCIKDEGFMQHFIDDFEEMEEDVQVLDSDDLLDVDWGIYWSRDIETLIVENGQGLLLDKNYAPEDENGRTDIHTTPSNCGIDGAIAAIGNDCYSKDIVANYISRTYFTRHGAGPFPEEDSSLKFKDETNISNAYQDSLKFGKIDEASAAQLLTRIRLDSSRNYNTVRKYNLIMTHCNEVSVHSSLKSTVKFISSEDDSKKVLNLSNTHVSIGADAI